MQDRPPALIWGTRMLVALLMTAVLVVAVRSDRESAADVAHTDGSVWLVSPVTGQASLVNSSTMEVTAEITVANEGEPVEAVQFGSDALVLNRATGEIGRLDGSQLTYGPTMSMGGSGADLEIITGGGQPYVLNAGEGWIRAIDPLTLNALGTAEVSPGVISAAVARDGRLWVADQGSGQIKLVDETGLAAVADYGEPNRPISIVLADDRPHIVDPGRAEVVVVEPDELTTGDPTCLPDDADDVLAAGSVPGVEPRAVYSLAPTDTGTTELFISDLGEDRCRTIDLGDSNGDHGQPVASRDAAYVPVLNGGRVIVVTPSESAQTVRTVRVVPESERFELFVKDDQIWFNNMLGPEAGTIDATGRVLRVAKYEDGEPLFGSQAAGDGGRIDNSLVGGSEGEAAGTPADDGAAVAASPIRTNDPVGGSDETVEQEGADPDDNGDGSGDGTGAGDRVDPAPATDDERDDEEPPVETFDPEFDDLSNDLNVIPPADLDDLPEAEPEPAGPDTGPTTTTTPPPSPSATPVPTTAPTPLPSIRPSEPTPTESATAPSTDQTDTAQPNSAQPGSAQPNTVAADPVPTPDSGVTTATPSTGSASDPGELLPRVVNEQSTGADRNAQLNAHFEISSSTVEVDQLVAFTDLSSGSPSAWTWDFGDGSSASGREVQTSWTSAGTYTVTLTVSDDNRSDSTTTSITVIDPASPNPPAANFTYTSATAEVGERVTFRDQSAGRPTTWLWDWGDGDTSTGAEASHSWDRAGSYTVRLTVGNESGETEARFRVTIIDKVLAPTASFDLSSEIVTVKEPISFTNTSTGNPTSVIWDFGDGSSGIGDQVNHSFSRPGQYTITLAVSNSKGRNSFERTVVVRTPSQPPEARFTLSDTQVGVGTPVLFTDASVGSPDTIIWNFGDGTTGTGSSVSHAWSRPGAYRVRLTVTNEAGTAENVVAVNVVEAVSKPVALFTRSPSDEILVDEPVRFVDQSQNEPTVWSWDFGDGTSSSQQSPVHRFRAAGTYAVTFTAGNERGQSSTTKTVIVGDGEIAPDAAFVFSPSSPAVGNEVGFEDRSSANTASWLWDFGDGSTSTARNPVYVYSTTGTFLVTLTASNGSGTDSVQQTITVRSSDRPQPSGSFDWIPSRPAAGERVTFIDFTPGAVTTPIWGLPGGEVPSVAGERQIEYTFENSGSFEISMRVCWIEEPNNCRVRTRSVRVSPPSAAPIAGFEVGGAIIDQSRVLLGDVVIFSDTSSGSDIDQSVWTIDGQTFEGSELEQVFDRVGEIDVVLTVDNSVGSDSISRRIEVVDATAPRADFGVTANPAYVEEPLSFVDQSDGQIDTWSWDFGDGSTSTQATPDHAYLTPGTYVATLTVTNPWGSDTTSRSIEVSLPSLTPNPVIELSEPDGASLESSPTVAVGQEILFEDISRQDGQTTRRWNFGDGTIMEGQQVSHAFSEAGTYVIELRATNANGETRVRAEIRVR